MGEGGGLEGVELFEGVGVAAGIAVGGGEQSVVAVEDIAVEGGVHMEAGENKQAVALADDSFEARDGVAGKIGDVRKDDGVEALER
jgi:hypothetical protein